MVQCMSSVEQQTAKKEKKLLQNPSPLSGSRLPVGRPKGTPNRVTKTIREAVEIAAREVTDSKGKKGLAAWLLERANGSVADRQIFAGMVAKALPLTINGNGAGITINLGWLAGRGIVDVAPAKQAMQKSNIIDAELDHQADEKAPPTPHQSAGGEGG